MPKEKNDNRPLSPHLQIYAWNISSLTSILHRATGVLLYLFIVAISWYVVFYTYNISVAPEDGVAGPACDCAILKYSLCAVIFGVIFSLYYHFCNGIRHLFWDIGKGYEVATARKTGYFVILCAILLSALTIGSIAFFKFM